MVDPIHGAGPAFPLSEQQSPQEQQKLFEIQFYTAVLGDYVAVSEKNGSLKQQLSQLKNGIKSGKSPDHLASEINHLVDQINRGISPGKAKFPPFQFTTDGAESSVLMNYVVALEKVVTTAGEHGTIQWSHETELFDKLSGLYSTIRGMPTGRAFEEINQMIAQVNQDLPAHNQIPSLPDMLRR